MAELLQSLQENYPKVEILSLTGRGLLKICVLALLLDVRCPLRIQFLPSGVASMEVRDMWVT